MHRTALAMLVGSVLVAVSSALAQTTAPAPDAARSTLADWWWIILIVVVVAAAAWYYTRGRTQV